MFYFRVVNFVLTFMLFFSVVSLPEARAQASCDYDRTIVFGGLDWDSDRFHVAVARFILENGYQCDTDIIPGSSLPLLTALANGDIDVLMEIWPENIREAWDSYTSNGQVVALGTNFPDAIQGFFVPTYMIKGDPERGIEPQAPDLRQVTDLPAYKDLFADPERPGFGRFYNCILGWTCEIINTKKLDVYGLTEHFTNFRPGAGAALASAVASAYERGRPIVTYYWGPTWVLGRYEMTMLEEPPFDPQIWQYFNESDNPTMTTAYPSIEVLVGANAAFASEATTAAKFLSNYETTNLMVSSALAFLEDNPGSTMDHAAMAFLRDNREVWHEWVEPLVAVAVDHALANYAQSDDRPILAIDTAINDMVNAFVIRYADQFDLIAIPLRALIVIAEATVEGIPWWSLIAILCALAGAISLRIWLPLVVFCCLFFVYALGLWELATQTIALMFIATFVATVIGIPLGILMAKSNPVRTVTLPILDAMQTMPSFVYLVPALMLFGLGKVPALFATVIYAIPPLIKLTDHGIRMVDAQIVEAARAFGANRRQLLTSVQLPLALPTIMAGVNQTTMLALSMVVIASMIGARGLGEQVLLGIQRLDVGQGFTAGIAIVALAIVFDRITQAAGRRFDKTK